MRDLLGALPAPPPPAPREATAITAREALALAFAHDHALSFPRRAGDGVPTPIPSDSWLANYAATQGAHLAERFRTALQRLPHQARAALAADLLTEVPPHA